MSGTPDASTALYMLLCIAITGFILGALAGYSHGHEAGVSDGIKALLLELCKNTSRYCELYKRFNP